MIIPISFIKKRWVAALQNLRYGTLHFITPEGERMTFTGREPGIEADFKLNNWKVLRRLIARGDIALGEDYVTRKWQSSNVENLISLFLMNLEDLDGFAHGSFFSRLGFGIYNRLLKRNSRRGSKHNIKSHYDVGNDFYKLWLDDSMTYSSALYENSEADLTTAQHAKYRRILDKLRKPNATLLEIGCGWGGFAEEAAKRDHDVTAVTISQAQHDYSTKRLGHRAKVMLKDYRDIKGVFDNIVSIEMFEAVGERYWPDFFKTVNRSLNRGGSAIVQTITIADKYFADYRTRSDYIRHYVFPGGMLPSMERFRDEAAKAGLECVEVFSFGQDYARTLREWSARLAARRSEILAMGHTEAFIRTWEFYLGICAAAFTVGRTDVVQVELAHAA